MTQIAKGYLMWVLVGLWSCQGSPNDRDVSQKASVSADVNQSSKVSRSQRQEIDEIPANLKANLKGFDLFSCIQKTEGSPSDKPVYEVCFEVSRGHLGNDDTAIQYAQAYCGTNQWVSGKKCPQNGVVSVCKGAVLPSGLTYDKYAYTKGIAFDEECQANGGQQMAVAGK